jgi:hypothetical protein
MICKVPPNGVEDEFVLLAQAHRPGIAGNAYSLRFCLLDGVNRLIKEQSVIAQVEYIDVKALHSPPVKRKGLG